MTSSTLTLDRSDPGIDELVSKWKDGGEYELKLNVKQVSSSPESAEFEVTGVEPSESDSESESPESESEDMPHEEGGMKGEMGKGGMDKMHKGMHKGPAIVIAFKK